MAASLQLYHCADTKKSPEVMTDVVSKIFTFVKTCTVYMKIMYKLE